MTARAVLLLLDTSPASLAHSASGGGINAHVLRLKGSLCATFGLVALVAGLAAAVPARAETNIMTAKNLLDVCTTADMHWIDFCNGFFQAVHDMGASEKRICTPDGITRTELVELYEKVSPGMFNGKPWNKYSNGAYMAMEIMANAYPCQN